MRRVAAAAALMLLTTARLACAQTSETPAHATPTWEIGVRLGIGGPASIKDASPAVDCRKIFVAAHATATFLRWGRWSLAYAGDVAPLFVVTGVPRRWNGEQLADPAPAAGVALTPIGFESRLRLGERWRAYVGGGAGAAWFLRDVPVPNSRAVNYTAEYNAGVQWRFRPRTSLSVGYMFHHLSNAATGYENPGLNGRLLTVGISRTF
jgi:hypothetical protein